MNRALRMAAAAVVAAAVALGISGCSGGRSGAAPALVYCGTHFTNGGAAADMIDVSHAGTMHVTNPPLFLQLTGSCNAGGTVRIEPASAGTVYLSVKARNGKGYSGVAIKPYAQKFDVIVTRGKGDVTRIHVALDYSPPPS